MMKAHLRSRGMYDPTVICTEDTATFLLYNLSGQLTGLQEYNPSKPKKEKYKPYGWGVWGTHRLNPELDVLYVVEGVFDACVMHNFGANCIAVLCNNPKKLKNWLKTVPYTTVAVCDGNNAGKSLGKYCDAVVGLPEGEDLNSIFFGETYNEELVRNTLDSLRNFKSR